MDRARHNRPLVQWSLAGGLIANVIAYAICVPLLARYATPKCRRSGAAGTTSRCAHRWSNAVGNRGYGVELVGPKVSGIIALFRSCSPP